MDFLLTASAAAVVGATLLFVVYFATETRWTKSPMGQSLMVMALGILLLSSQGLFFQIAGPHYPGREWYVLAGRVLVFGAMIQRVWALLDARRADR